MHSTTSSPAHVEDAYALIRASHEPQLLLSSDQVVLAASRSFCQAFDLDPAWIVGRKMTDLGIRELASPGFQALLTASSFGSIPVAPMEIALKRHKRPIRTLVVHVNTLDGGPDDQLRLLVAFTDETSARNEARRSGQLIRHQAIVIQEAQHRIANSLQIVAGLLAQDARRVQSEEARQSLHDAYHRVMAVAAVQKQLSATGDDNVSLQGYLTRLCVGLASSLISDASRLSITTVVEDRVVSGAEAASLGLIVTELIINALKYAFPDGRTGVILVDYRSDACDWVLSVSDNGVGFATGRHETRTGLGTGIVAALSRNLHAEVVQVGTQPGTRVTITHHEVIGMKAVLSATV
jgi:two-component sensor histidine kinase